MKTMGSITNELIQQRYKYREEMLKIAILRAWIIEDWPRDRLFWTALHDIKDDSCIDVREELAAHGYICRYKSMECLLWRGKHILTWDDSTFTAYDDPQFKLPEPNLIYPVDNWSI
jgi:hypothetical protein